MATLSIPQGVRGRHVVASAYCFMYGREKANKKHGQEKVVVRRNTGWKMLFKLPHEDAGLEALHFHGEA
jgi:hypothetical protein